MNQNTAQVLMLAGLSAFLLGFGAELMTAHSWADVTTPAMLGKALVQLGGVGTAIFGARKMKA